MMKKILRIGPKLVNIIRHDGVGRVIDIAGAHFAIKERRKFESRFRLNTEESLELTHLTIGSQNRSQGFYYTASPPRVVHSFLSNLPDVRDYVLVDFGSGKGIVLLIAAEYPFKSVIGVEFARELHETALTNIDTCQNPAQVCQDVRSLHLDATEFDVPSDPCILYFCNPFTEDIMARVLENVRQSFLANNQKIFILFHQQADEDTESEANPIPLFESADFLVERPFRPRSVFDRICLKHLRMKIYETMPQSSNATR